MDPKPSEYMDTDGHTSEALKPEQIRLVKGLEGLDQQTRVKTQQVIAVQRSRGVLSSGGTVRRAASPHFDRAKKSIDQTLESVTPRRRDLLIRRGGPACVHRSVWESLKPMGPSA